MRPESIIPVICLVAVAAIALMTVRRSRTLGAACVVILCAAVALWAGAFALPGAAAAAARANANLTAILIFCLTLAASAQLIFALWYTNRPDWFARYTILLLTAMPLLTQALFWTRTLHEAFFDGRTIFMSNPAFRGPWGTVIAIYVYNLLGACLLLLIDRFIRKPRSLLLRSWTILAGALAPFAILTSDLLGLDPITQYHSLLVAFTLSALGFAYGLFGRQLIEVVPVTREAVVEGMDDGWIVLDTRNIIVDINPAAEKIIGLSRDKVYGQPIVAVLGDLPNLGQNFGINREYEMKRSVRSQEGWRYLNIRISSLSDARRSQFGRLIIWRDITERKLADDARQRARDEMFVLLNAISSAASNSINLDEFLSESIYHIIYPFRSQIVAIFLVDEREENEEPTLSLASHVGLPAEAADEMQSLPLSSQLFAGSARTRQSLLIEDTAADHRLPPTVRELGFASFLSIPLITQSGEKSRVIGFLCLARKEKPGFSQDEIVRLTTISDHIATLIDSDRRRKLAIVLSEREKLMRDLHDSVSQKLYGLVTLTEAAQAGLEAGTAFDPSQVLTRIGENARQAVKEMRLFLYQMQSIDVEKDGLVSVLHHRLAAVEGRADMKARLLAAEEEILLSKDKEIALYYIAQEALNNVLRHARATTVTVTLKQGRQNVILEILDDGRGFDPKKVDGGGLGLQNMRERAVQVNGKLKIHSKPDEGTKIVVNVRKDHGAKARRKQ